MPGKKVIVFLILWAPCFLFSSISEESHSPGWVDFLGKSLNFLILFGGLAFLLAKPLRSFLEGRALGIQETIKEAEESRKSTEAKLEAIQKRLQGLEDEIKKIRDIGNDEGFKEQERIQTLARQEAEKIKSYARKQIDLHRTEFVRELREFAAELAVVLAKERMGKKLTPQVHSRLIDESIQKLGTLYENSNIG